MSIEESHEELVRRLKAAYADLHRLSPNIYPQSRVDACVSAAKRMTVDELLYFVLSAENTVTRKLATAEGI